jgi:hypothetical protein
MLRINGSLTADGNTNARMNRVPPNSAESSRDNNSMRNPKASSEQADAHFEKTPICTRFSRNVEGAILAPQSEFLLCPIRP